MNQIYEMYLAANAVGLCFLRGSCVDRGKIHLLLLFLLGTFIVHVLYNFRLGCLNHLAFFSIFVNLGGQLCNSVIHESCDSLGKLDLLFGQGNGFVRLAFEC